MKHGFKRISKTTISLILALCMLITMAVPVMAKGIQTLIDRITELSQTGDDGLKGEKIVGEDGKEFYRLDSMTEDQYAAFGLNTKTTPATFTSSPEEEIGSYTKLPGLMSIGMYHNGTNQDNGAVFNVYRSDSIKDNTDNNFNLVKNTEIYYNNKFDHDDKDNNIKYDYAQEQNMEGIDVNGDGFDEIATVRLSNPMYVELYNPLKYETNDHYTKLDEWSTDLSIGTTISDLEPNETMGYMALTAGDFDGDGCEELAVYVPDAYPIFYLLKYADGSLKELSSFRLEDISDGKGKRLVYKADGNKLPQNGAPIVSLSTTSISGKDQIVFNASLPMRYDGYDNRSCMAILDYDGSSLKEVYSDDLTYDNGAYRMRYASATDGDLYGDGEQTLIVGGYKNDNLGSDSTKYNTKQGSLNGGTNLVQIIKYNTEENKYERGDLKTASRHSNGLCKMDKDRKITNPMAIAAVNFTNSANAPEFLFLGGKIFKWSDDDALAEKMEMSLGKYNDDDPFIVKAFAMRGIDGNYMQEQLFVIAGDTDAGRGDHDYMHTHTIINTNNAGKVDGIDATADDVQLKDNFVDSWTRVDEDDHGDFCTAAPLQCNGYGATVRCTDKSVGWSDITVEAVLQSVPYWEELTYGDGKGESSFTISSGKSTGKEHEVVHSNGGFLELSVVLGFEIFDIGGHGGIKGSVEGHKNHGNQDGKEYAVSGSLTINSHAGSDTAVLSATAIGHYLYEVYLPEHIVTATEHEYMVENYEAYGYNSPGDVPAVGQLSKAYTTPWINHVNYGQTYSSIEVNKFNAKVQDYYDAGGGTDKLGKIDMSMYNSAVIGDAYSYPADTGDIRNYVMQQEYIDIDGNTEKIDMIFKSQCPPVTVSSNADSDAEIEIEFEQTITSGSSSGYDIGGTAGLTGELDVLIVEAEASAGYSGEREENTIYSDSTITGKSFGVQVCNWENYNADGDNSEVPEDKYNFSVAPVVLQSRPLSNGDTPFMLTYAVTPLNSGHIAPAIPDDIHVNTVSSSALNVTWKNIGTPERPVSQYEIFQRNVSAKEDTFVSVGTVDATATSFLATNLEPETTYAYKVRSIYDGTYSVCSSEAQGTTLPLDGSGPSFIKHPVNAYVKEADVNSGTTVTFDALAVPASKDHSISYQWQKLETSGVEGSVSQWVNLSDNTESNPTAFSGTKTTTLSVALNSGNAEELNGAIFKVIAVEEGLGTARIQAVSRSAQLVISEDEPIKTSTDLKMTNVKDAAATVTDANGDPVQQGKVTFYLYKRSDDSMIAVDEQATVDVNNGTASYTFSDKANSSESNYGFFALYTDDAHAYASSCDLVTYENVVHLTADEGANVRFIADEGKPEIKLPVAVFAQGTEVRFKVDLTSEQYRLDSVEAFTMTSGALIELSEQDGVYSFIMPDESVMVNAKTAFLPAVTITPPKSFAAKFFDSDKADLTTAFFDIGSEVWISTGMTDNKPSVIFRKADGSTANIEYRYSDTAPDGADSDTKYLVFTTSDYDVTVVFDEYTVDVGGDVSPELIRDPYYPGSENYYVPGEKVCVGYTVHGTDSTKVCFYKHDSGEEITLPYEIDYDDSFDTSAYIKESDTFRNTLCFEMPGYNVEIRLWNQASRSVTAHSRLIGLDNGIVTDSVLSDDSFTFNYNNGLKATGTPTVYVAPESEMLFTFDTGKVNNGDFNDSAYSFAYLYAYNTGDSNNHLPTELVSQAGTVYTYKITVPRNPDPNSGDSGFEIMIGFEQDTPILNISPTTLNVSENIGITSNYPLGNLTIFGMENGFTELDKNGNATALMKGEYDVRAYVKGHGTDSKYGSDTVRVIVNDNHTVHIESDADCMMVFTDPDGNKISDADSGSYTGGDTVYFALADSGNTLNSLTVSTDSQGRGGEIEYQQNGSVYSFIMPHQDAYILPDAIKVKLVGGDHGNVYFADEEHVEFSEACFASGSTVKFTVTPDSGYEGNVVVATEDGSVSFSYVSGDSTYAFTMPNKNVTVAVAFENSSYNLLKDFRAIAQPSEIQIGEKSKVTIIDIDLTPMIITPSKNYTVSDMNLYSSDESIATVTANGMITGIAEGTVTITARLKSNPSIYDKCTVTVVAEKPTETPTEVPTETPTEAPTEAPTETPTEATTEAPTEAPTETPTEAPTEAPTETPTEPDPSDHGIRNYDELVEFALSVNGGNNGADAYLENNILVPADADEWTQPIGTEDKPFTGDFDGRGYCIIGLRINNAKYGSLFGLIGEGGNVHDVMVFDSRFTVQSEYASGIAAVNNGTIDHCTSGVNLSGKTKVKLPNGMTVKPADYNSIINGTYSGGITAINNGTITGCRNGSAVTGENCGGITSVNNQSGSIYGCANNGSLGSTDKSCKRCGGVACDNNGSIGSSYNSGKINCSYVDYMGSVAGFNTAEDVLNIFYSNVNNVAKIGGASEVDINDTNKLVDNSDMLKESFVKALSDVTDDSITWVRTKYGDTYFNQGYPTILGKFLEQKTLALSGKITISGVMHSSLNASAEELDTDSEEYEALAAADAEIVSAYSLATTDDNGSYVPAQLWTAGGIQLSVPVDELAETGADGDGGEKYLVLIVLGEDGEAVKVYPDSIEDGKAVFTLAAPTNFAVAQTTEAPVLLGDANGDGEVDAVDVTVIQRFDAMMNIAPITGEDLLARADVDGDGEITIIDATWIQRYSVNMKAPEGIGKPITAAG